jgi:hypothetical protein
MMGMINDGIRYVILLKETERAERSHVHEVLEGVTSFMARGFQ